MHHPNAVPRIFGTIWELKIRQCKISFWSTFPIWAVHCGPAYNICIRSKLILHYNFHRPSCSILQFNVWQNSKPFSSMNMFLNLKIQLLEQFAMRIQIDLSKRHKRKQLFTEHFYWAINSFEVHIFAFFSIKVKAPSLFSNYKQTCSPKYDCSSPRIMVIEVQRKIRNMMAIFLR